MVQTIQAKTITLRTLIDDFGIQWVDDAGFFREWRDDLPTVSPEEQRYLDRVRDGFINLLNYPPLLEDVVRMAIGDPLLFLGGFYLPPFHVRSEPSVEITTEDEGIIIKGSLDTLVLKDRLWVLVVESKLVQGERPQYATSKLFGIRDADDLYTVFAILKHLGSLI